MDYYDYDQLQKYFSKLLGADVKIISVSGMGGKEEETLKKGGHSLHRLIELELKGFRKKYVIELVTPSPFGHETMPDRAQVALLAHSTYNRLPLHARSLDCGVFMKDGSMVSVGNAEEFFMNVEFVEGTIYKVDLYNISERGNLTELDKQR
ncbi:MAG: hypothetical protein QXV37_01935, partial [Candidatus Jordarchaeaceae archaeon]